MPKNHYPKQGRNMHYKLIVTDEIEKLLNKHIEYLLNKFKSKQAASHLLDSLESLYNHLENNPFLYRKSQDPVLYNFHYREAKLTGLDYIVIYKIKNTTVYILGIFNCLENYSGKINTANNTENG